MPREIARRSLLASLSAAPAAVMAATLPSTILAHPAGAVYTPGADDALIVQAALVARLSRLHDRAHLRAGRKGDAVMLAAGRRPPAPDPQGSIPTLDEHPVDPASEVERCFTMTFHKPPTGDEEAKRRHAEALAAWEAEHDRLERAAGVSDASALCDALFGQLTDAVDALVSLDAAGPRGLAMKAGAFLALMETLDGAEKWVADLARSLARDAMRVGEADSMSALARIPRRRPVPAPSTLSPVLRTRIETCIEHLLSLLDTLDADLDLEPSFGYLPNGAVADECEPDPDAEEVDEDGDPLDYGERDEAELAEERAHA